MKKIGFTSTFNVSCGISTYGFHLIENYPKDSTIVFGNRFGNLSDTKDCNKFPIIRCWDRTGSHQELLNEILSNNIDVVHIQHEFGLFQNHPSLLNFLSNLKSNGIKTYLTLHTIFRENNIYNKRLLDYTNLANKVIVHRPEPKEVLNSDKIVVIPHGSVLNKPAPRDVSRKFLGIEDDRLVVLCLGFITPHKAAMDAISVIQRLRSEFPNILLLIVGMPVVTDTNFTNMEYCVDLFKTTRMINGFNNIKIIPKYVSESDLDYYAGATDLIIEGYKQTEYSISGISHLIMSYGLPSISSKANILGDLDETRSLKYEIGNIDEMTNNLRTLILDGELRSGLSDNCLKYTEEVSWPKIAERHLELYNEA